MLKQLFIRYYRSKFFAKILIANTVIILLIIAALVTIISQNVTRQISEKELSFNTVILDNVNKYYEHKLSVVRQMIEQIYFYDTSNYQNTNSYNFIFDLLEEPDKESDTYLSNRSKMETYLNSNFTRDSDITNIAIYSKTNDQSYLYSSNVWRVEDVKYFKALDWFSSFNDDLFGIRQTPAYKSEFSGTSTKWIYTVGANLKSKDLSRNAGVLLVNFDASFITKAYEPYKANVKGTVYILDSTGKIIFDSAGNYQELQPEIISKLINKTAAASFEYENQIINFLPAKDGEIVVGIISKPDMFAEVDLLKKNIYMLGLLCALISIILNLASMSVFSKKVRRIIVAIQNLPQGNLHHKINLETSDDEIGQIAFRLNLMQDKMVDYINDVYISEIKYKNAALIALQAQINPHFLSNTLEAIRMKAVKEGNEDVAEMIYILSFLLRTSLKSEKIVTIKEEVAYCELYLQLFSFRYQNKLKVKLEIDPEIEQYSIGKLTLQPLVENTIIHGINLTSSANEIYIKGEKSEEQIVIRIMDNGKGLTPEKLLELKLKLANYQLENNEDSIGLVNVHERIRLLYGEPYGLDIYGDHTGMEVRITIPARRIEVA